MSPVVTHLGLIGLAVVGLYLIIDSIRMILSNSTEQPECLSEEFLNHMNHL